LAINFSLRVSIKFLLRAEQHYFIERCCASKLGSFDLQWG
jgi:hypothetical protein